MSKYILIVESPTKAKTISKFLSNEYDIIACVGHVRDLPRNASDVPLKYKKEAWARLGINVEEDFTPLYITIKGKGKIISDIKKKTQEAAALILATDEDREGESIAWHINELVKPKIPVKRIVFHEITKSAISNALEHSRDIDINLVQAQESRRVLDRLFGYKLSELLWKKITYRMSAGRVQSPGLRLLVEKERERYLFNKVYYNDLQASLEYNKEAFEAKLISWNDIRIASGSDFDNQGALVKERLKLDNDKCTEIITALQNKEFRITGIASSEYKIKTPAPFITSTIQQEANKRMKLTARETMRTAQALYEQGHITYMRTDSYALSSQAINAARTYIKANFSENYLPETPNFFGKKKSKGAQEAHEAIRPSGEEFAHPNTLNLIGREKELYTLIWQRTIASQMCPAVKESTTITFTVEDGNGNTGVFQANGSVLTFPGFLSFYTYSKVDDKLLPAGLKENQTLVASALDIDAHETFPPSRYNDASLVKKLESLGIGRPSTYASIINTLLERDYARRVDQALEPTLTGFAVVQFLENNFPEYITYEFTSSMEEVLDKISTGEENYKTYLKHFYFGDSDKGLEQKVKEGSNIDGDISQRIFLPNLDKKYEIRVGQYGPFIIINKGTEAQDKFSIPADCSPSELHEDYILELAKLKRKESDPLGKDPETQLSVYCLTGRYGPYVQLGEISEDTPKPKRASIPKGTDMSNISLEFALKLLSIPRTLGLHPELKEEVIVANGRFGPYIKAGDHTRSLKKDDDMYSIDLARAMELLAEQPKTTKRKLSALVNDLGKYNQKSLGVYKGPYGYYLKFGTKNITLPDEYKEQKKAEALTIEDAKILVKNSNK